MEKLLITIGEALEITSVGKTRFYELMSSGVIRSVKLSKRRLIDVSSLKTWIASLPSEGLRTPTK